MKKRFFIVLLLLTSCGSGLDQSFNNFTAYYNTYYNAKQDFEAGLTKVESQSLQLNTDEPVLPHVIPPLAGEQDFESAVDNAAQILRRFSDSNWTDDALLLMGKSYYHLHEFFLARQKFEELLSLQLQTDLKPRAVIWKGQTLLAINAYTEGVQFIGSQLSDYGDQWTPELRAEAQIVRAQHYAMLENWQQTARLLEPALLNIKKGPLRGRGYFLLGQAFRRLGNLNLAYQAFSNVGRNFPAYEYIYNAEIQLAEIAQEQGSVDLAILLYTQMLNDDKNSQHRYDLYYQLAAAQQAQQNYSASERLYKQVLENSGSISPRLRSQAYYKLGQLYSEQYRDFELAAAYFDSSSVAATAEPEDDANRLASAYKRYVALKEDIARLDSLLALGALDESALNEQLAIVRQQRQKRLKESENQIQQTNNLLSNVEGENIYNNPEPPEGADSFGFLNYQNTDLVQRGLRRFRAVWGQRPLVDNWRRSETINAANIRDDETSSDSFSVERPPNALSDNQLAVDVSAIPRTEAAKKKLREERLNAEYRLGSLFFLTLEQPDSAAIYYRRVLQDSSAAKLQAQTLFSLYQLYSLQQQADSTAKYRDLIVQNHPNSQYAQRVTTNTATDGSVRETDNSNNSAQLRKRTQQIMAAEEPIPNRAQKLIDLARKNSSLAPAPAIFYEGIRAYIQYAKLPHADSTAADSSGNRNRVNDANSSTYSGSRWDRVRQLLDEFLDHFPGTTQAENVKLWTQELDQPVLDESPLNCSDIGAEPAVMPGMQQFLDSISLPEKLSGMNLSGTIRYKLVIAADGRVASYTLLSPKTELGIEEVYEKAIMDNLQFEPLRYNGNAVRVSCEVEFPIKQ